MTDREAAVYKYYRDRGQVEKAQEYLDALEMDVNQRAAMQKQEDAKKLAEESTAAALYAVQWEILDRRLGRHTHWQWKERTSPLTHITHSWAA